MNDFELNLRKSLGVPIKEKKPAEVFRELTVFWAHFAIYKRKCDGSGKTIYSVYDDNCPFPVWDKTYWVENANPPSAIFDFSRGFYDQLYDLFKNCPIPHNCGINNINCDYTDDCWHSKNCYLCHSLLQGEDCHYCFRIVNNKDCYFTVFSNDLELCLDVINSSNLYKVNYAINCQKCTNSSFLFDCRGVEDCFMCYNLRNKKYCFRNEQLTKEQYEENMRMIDLSSTSTYNRIKTEFHEIIKTKAYFKAIYQEQCENSYGNYLENCKNAQNVFLSNHVEDTINTIRAFQVKSSINCVSPALNSERLYYCSVIEENSYECKFCDNLTNCKFLEYCEHCLNCEYCFGCRGLVNKKYHILNKEYSPAEYQELTTKIKEKIINDGLEDVFFPPYFAANNYEDSLANVIWPLKEEEKNKGYRISKNISTRQVNYLDSSLIPDSCKLINSDITKNIYWDDIYQKPFSIRPEDIEFAKKTNTPLHHTYYLRRLKDNYKWVFFDGELRKTTCAKTGQEIFTTIPREYDGRILSNEAYLDLIV